MIDVTVTPAADAPVNTVPPAQGTILNEPLVFSSANFNALTVSDAEGNLATTRITVTNGVANVTLSGGATITAGANGSTTLTLSGTQAAINATLNGLRYTPTAAFTGSASLTMLSTDSGGLTDTDVVSIYVAGTADAVQVDLDDGTAASTFADTFASGGYAGSTGTNVWVGNWVESDPEGAAQSAAAGDVR